MQREKLLILGVSGMLGHVLFKKMSKNAYFEVLGTVRNKRGLDAYFSHEEISKIISEVDADNFENVLRTIVLIRPTIIVNCIGIIKQLPISKDPIKMISINALFPHQLSKVAKIVNARLIHISTDCVFDGEKGNYIEEDISNAEDLYGKTKYLGEVLDPHCVTLRTSIIGHELKTNFGLVDWFMTQENEVKGFTKAIYSGFPTVEMVNIISNYVIPHKELSGLYHISSEPISKYCLLNIIKSVYKKDAKINAFDDFMLDRSMNSDRFKNATGYKSPSWEKLIQDMYYHAIRNDFYKDKFFRKEKLI